MADAGRVIAGRAKGIRLAAPGTATRPLTDRVKQTLFAILEPGLDGARVLDLFAGSGAGGIEALSRGAASAVFVERDGAALRALRENLRRCGFGPPIARVDGRDVEAWLVDPAASPDPADLVLVDPPYDSPDLLERTLAALGPRHLAPGARVAAKHFWRTPPPARTGLLASERVRRFGETALTFYRRSDAGEPVEEDGDG